MQALFLHLALLFALNSRRLCSDRRSLLWLRVSFLSVFAVFLSSRYSSYFGGDLDVVSVEGYGTDAYLYLSKLKDYNLFLE